MSFRHPRKIAGDPGPVFLGMAFVFLPGVVAKLGLGLMCVGTGKCRFFAGCLVLEACPVHLLPEYLHDHLSRCLNSLDGIILGSIIGVTKGDTRSLDFSLFGPYSSFATSA